MYITQNNILRYSGRLLHRVLSKSATSVIKCMYSNLFTPFSETCFSPHRILRNPHFLKDIWRTRAAPNFTHIGRETWRILEEINLYPQVNYDPQ